MAELPSSGEKKYGIGESSEFVVEWVKNTEAGHPRREAATLGLTIASALETKTRTESAMSSTTNVRVGQEPSRSEKIDAVVWDGATRVLARASEMAAAKIPQNREFDEYFSKLKVLLDKSDASATEIMQNVNNRLRCDNQPQLMFG